MSGNLFLLCGKNPEIVKNKVDSILEPIGSESVVVDNFSDAIANCSDLFGTPLPIVFYVNNKSEVEDLKKRVSKEPFLSENLFADTHLIIAVNNQVTNKKLINYCEASSLWEVVKLDADVNVSQVLSPYGLNRGVINFLDAYLGDEKMGAYSIERNLKTMERKDIKNLTIEDIYSWLPQPKGSVPPWEWEKNFGTRNVLALCDDVDRILNHQGEELLFYMVKNKVEMILKIYQCYNSAFIKKSSEETIFKACNLKSARQATFLSNKYKNYSLDQILKLEKLYKGLLVGFAKARFNKPVKKTVLVDFILQANKTLSR